MHYYEFTSDFEGLCGSQERNEMVLRNIHLSSVHVVHNRPEVREGDIFQENNWLLVSSLLTKEILEFIKKQQHIIR